MKYHSPETVSGSSSANRTKVSVEPVKHLAHPRMEVGRQVPPFEHAVAFVFSGDTQRAKQRPLRGLERSSRGAMYPPQARSAV